jgi:hypothetical protein
MFRIRRPDRSVSPDRAVNSGTRARIRPKTECHYHDNDNKDTNPDFLDSLHVISPSKNENGEEQKEIGYPQISQMSADSGTTETRLRQGYAGQDAKSTKDPDFRQDERDGWEGDMGNCV